MLSTLRMYLKCFVPSEAASFSSSHPSFPVISVIIDSQITLEYLNKICTLGSVHCKYLCSCLPFRSTYSTFLLYKKIILFYYLLTVKNFLIYWSCQLTLNVLYVWEEREKQTIHEKPGQRWNPKTASFSDWHLIQAVRWKPSWDSQPEAFIFFSVALSVEIWSLQGKESKKMSGKKCSKCRGRGRRSLKALASNVTLRRWICLILSVQGSPTNARGDLLTAD